MLREKLAGFSKDAAVYGIGDALGRVIGLVLLPILSRVFGPADYGAIDLLTISYAFLLIAIRLGVPTGVQRFYYRREGAERRRLLSSCLAFLLLVAMIGGALVALLAGPIARAVGGPFAEVRLATLVLAACVPVELLWNFLVLLLRLERRAVTFSMANVALVVLTPALTVLFVVGMDRGLAGVFAAKLVGLVVVTAGLAVLTRRAFGREVRFGVFTEVLRFALPGHPALLIKNLMNLLPRYLLASYAPLAAVGLFGIAARIGSVMRIYVEAFNRAWNPFAYANEGAPDERRLYEVVFKAFYASLLVVGLVLSLFAPEALGVLTPAAYAGAAALVPGVVGSLALDGLVLVFSTLLYTRDRVRWSSYLGAGRLVVFLAVGFWLVPTHGAAGVVGAMVVAALAHFLAYGAVALRAFPFAVPRARLAGLTLVAVAAATAVLRAGLDPAAAIVVKLLLVAATAFAAVRLLLDAHERTRLRGLLVRAR